MSNLRFQKVFVIDPVNTNLITGALVKPPALTAKQCGFFKVDEFGVTVGGTGATPAPATNKRIKISQNVGDNKFGAVSTQIINVNNVTKYFAQKARNAQNQITYIGWDEVVGTKDITAICGKEIEIPIMIYEKRMARFYAPQGFLRTLVIDTGCCPDCGSPCTAADKTFLANEIANQINNGLVRPGDYSPQNELGAYLTATVVTNGLADADLRVGVKIESKPIDNDAQAALDSCDPVKYWEFLYTHFTIGTQYNGICEGTSLPITTTQQADPGTGWPAALAALEAESQGYDRVRDALTEYPFSKKNNYVIYAKAGTKYDYFHVQYTYTHDTSARVHNSVTEPYEAIIACPTTTGDPIEALLNAWLTGKFDAVNLNP